MNVHIKYIFKVSYTLFYTPFKKNTNVRSKKYTGYETYEIREYIIFLRKKNTIISNILSYDNDIHIVVSINIMIPFF